MDVCGPYLDAECTRKAAGESLRLAQLALPHYQYAPAELTKRGYAGAIALTVALQFGQPEIRPRRRNPSSLAIVAMPEAAMHEHDCLVAHQHNIRGSRKFSLMEPKPQSQSMQD